MEISNTAFARRMARLLGYGTRDFPRNVKELSDKINQRFSEKKISEYTIKSWLTQGKFPQRKNLELVAEALGEDPDRLIAPEEKEEDENEVRVGFGLIKSLEEVFEKSLPFFKDKYLKLEDLPPQKAAIIKNILKIKNEMSLSLVEQATEIGLAQDKKIEEARGGKGKDTKDEDIT